MAIFIALFQVLVPKYDTLMGKLVDVEIIETTKFSMLGKVLGDNGSISSPALTAPKTSSDGERHGFIYKLSIVILFLAILVRTIQIFTNAFSDKQHREVPTS